MIREYHATKLQKMVAAMAQQAKAKATKNVKVTPKL